MRASGIKLTIYTQSILNGYIDTTNKILQTIKKENIPVSKNLSNDTLKLLDFDKNPFSNRYFSQNLSEQALFIFALAFFVYFDSLF